MALETRGKRKYHYRKVRVGRKVRSIYVGTEEAAYEAVQRAQQRRQAQKEERASVQKAQEELRRQLESGIALCQKLELWMRASLLEAGFHRDVNAIWRRRSAQKSQI